MAEVFLDTAFAIALSSPSDRFHALAVTLADRIELSGTQEKNIQGAPDLVVEILSSATSDRDTQLKHRLYARHGVREYWIVEPAAGSVEVFTRRQGDFELIQTYTGGDVLESPLLEGFRLPLTPIFRKLI